MTDREERWKRCGGVGGDFMYDRKWHSRNTCFVSVKSLWTLRNCKRTLPQRRMVLSTGNANVLFADANAGS